MEVLFARCAGLDVHKDTVVACVRCVSAPEHREVRTFGTTTRALVELGDWLASHGVTHVAMEATGVYWKPIWHMLEERFTQVLANAQHIKNVPGRKTDVNDAMWIADLLAHGLIRSSFVPPPRIQELRDLMRSRKQIVREISQHTLRIQKTLEDANIKVASVLSSVVGTSGPQDAGGDHRGPDRPCCSGRAGGRDRAEEAVGADRGPSRSCHQSSSSDAEAASRSDRRPRASAQRAGRKRGKTARADPGARRDPDDDAGSE